MKPPSPSGVGGFFAFLLHPVRVFMLEHHVLAADVVSVLGNIYGLACAIPAIFVDALFSPHDGLVADALQDRVHEFFHGLPRVALGYLIDGLHVGAVHEVARYIHLAAFLRSVGREVVGEVKVNHALIVQYASHLHYRPVLLHDLGQAVLHHEGGGIRAPLLPSAGLRRYGHVKELREDRGNVGRVYPHGQLLPLVLASLDTAGHGMSIRGGSGRSNPAIVALHDFGADAGTRHHELAGNVVALDVAHDTGIAVLTAFTLKGDSRAELMAQSVEADFHLFAHALDALVVTSFAHLHGGHLSGNGVDVLFEQAIAEAVLFVTASLVGSGNLGVGIQLGLEHGVLGHEGGSLIAVAVAEKAAQKTAVAVGKLIHQADSASNAETEGSASNTLRSEFSHENLQSLRQGGMPRPLEVSLLMSANLSFYLLLCSPSCSRKLPCSPCAAPLVWSILSSKGGLNMPVKDYNADPDLNTQISGINIAEGCAPSGINNAIRQLMADVKEEFEGEEGAVSSLDTALRALIAKKVSTVNGLAPDSNGNVDVGGMPLGTLIPYTGKNVPAGTLRADGTTYTDMRSSFPKFYEWVVNSGLTVALGSYALVEGSCGYYGLDASTGTVRMPTLAAGVFGTNAAGMYGQAVQAGLPNITGVITTLRGANVTTSGALSTSQIKTSNYLGTATGGEQQITFNASHSSPIYGRSNTVTPSHVKYPWVIVVYNAAVPPSVAEAAEFVNLLDEKVDKVNPKDSNGNDILTSAGGSVEGLGIAKVGNLYSQLVEGGLRELVLTANDIYGNVGAVLALRNVLDVDNPGGLVMATRNTDGSFGPMLSLNRDGSAWWNGHPIPTLVASWHDGGALWYRKYSDGFIMQGGNVNLPSGQSPKATIRLHTAFATNVYSVSGAFTDDITRGSNSDSGVYALNRTKTTFQLSAGYSFSGCWVYWFACGY